MTKEGKEVKGGKEEPFRGDLELNEFLSEMVSLIKNKLDKQKNTIINLEERINKLEGRNIKGMIDSKFRKYNGVVEELKEKLAGL